MSYYYFSFCDGTLPKGTQFLGACLVELEEDDSVLPIPAFAIGKGADGVAQAITKSHLLGINPGGEVMTIGPMDLDAEKAKPWLHRLLTRDEAENMPDLS